MKTFRRIMKVFEEDIGVYVLIVLTMLLTAALAVGIVHSFDSDKTQTGTTQPSVAQETHEYEVMSVFQYTETKTNSSGAVLSTDVCYAFTYIDENGELQSVQGFRDLKGGITKVSISPDIVDRYIIVRSGLITYQYLTLSKETLKNLTSR